MAMRYRTARFVAHGADLAVSTNDLSLRDALDDVLAPLAAPGAPATWIQVMAAADGQRYHLTTERGSRMTVNQGRIVPLVVSVLNHYVMKETRDRILVHAAAAERNGSAIILPAPMEAGKTTTVAGLVRRGWRYLTDETVAIDPGTLEVEPYHKPLSIDPGSWATLSELEPHAHRVFQTEQWQVPVTSVRVGALGGRCRPRWIVTPRFDSRTSTRLQAVTKARMLLLLGEMAFAGGIRQQEAFPRLAELVRRCECFELSVGSLEEAVELLDGLHDAGD